MFLKNRFFIILFSIAAISALGILVDVLYGVAIAALCLFAIVSIADAVMLMTLRLEGKRSIASKLDLGEENIISFNVKIKRGRLRGAYVIDEIPTEFLTDTDRHDMEKDRDGNYGCHYAITPSCRGHFELGKTLVFASFLGLLERRIVLVNSGKKVDVYPAFSRLREKDEQVRSKQILSTGSHKRQLPANQTEFRDIREYVVGDDIRTINWKATARTGNTMVNEYEDERSQHIVNVIDCGSAMQRTFHALSLQDHAINASLLVSYSALEKESDCVGVCSYGPKGISFLPPRAGKVQFKSIMQQLYALGTEYGESDIEQLCLMLDRNVKRRSLVFLYTEIPTMSALERQLQFFKRISTRNCLVVVNCLDKELESVSERHFEGKTQRKYHSQCVERTLAKDMVNQKQLIADTLQQNGIYCLSIYPEALSFGVLKKYLELKEKRAW
jgi:uncharacterized protein (DUF58 family)